MISDDVLCDQADEVDFLYRRLEQRAWEEQQRSEAPAVLALLRQHMPAEPLERIENLLSTLFGCECVNDLVRREQEGKGELPEDSVERLRATGTHLEQGASSRIPSGAQNGSSVESQFRRRPVRRLPWGTGPSSG